MSQDLFSLVHSLSASEKRYFRMATRPFSNERRAHYLVLFDILLQQEQYDAPSEVGQLREAGIDIRPALVRAQLKKRIYEVMRAFHADRDVEISLLQGIQDLEFLWRKDLRNLLRKEIRRLRKLAKQHEHFHLLVLIDNFSRQLQKKQLSRNIRADLDKTLQDMRHHLERYSNQLQYTHLLDLMTITARRDLRPSDRERDAELEQVMQHPLLSSPEKAHTHSSRMYFHQMHAIHHQVKGQIAPSAAHYAQVIAIWDTVPHFIRERPRVYRRTLGNYLSACYLLEDFAPFPDIIAKIRQSPASGPSDDTDIFDLGYSYEILYWLGTNRWEEARAAIPEIEEGLARHQAHIRRDRILYFRYNIAILFFLLEDHRQALRQFRLILEEKHTGQREDLRRAVFLLRLLSLFDATEIELLEYEFRNTRRLLLGSTDNDSLTPMVLEAMNTLIQVKDRNEFREVIASLHKQLVELEAASSGAMPAAWQEIRYWATAKLQGRTIWEVASGM